MNKYKRIRINKNTTRDKHRLVMEEYLGRKLLTSEIIHHINKDRSDNRIENLEITTRQEHAREHVLSGDIHKLNVYDSIKGGREKNRIMRGKRKIDENHFVCTWCKKVKNKDMFHKNRTKAWGISCHCAECVKNIKYNPSFSPAPLFTNKE